MCKKVKMNRREMKKFNKDPLKGICMHIGQEIQLPKKKEPRTRYFICRFDDFDENNQKENGGMYPDFVEELPKKELECLALEGGSGVTASKLIKGINGGK